MNKYTLFAVTAGICSSTALFAADKVPATLEHFSNFPVGTSNSQVSLVKSVKLSNGKLVEKYEQTFQGVKIYGSRMTRSVDNSNVISSVKLSGRYVENITDDLSSVSPKLNADRAIEKAMAHRLGQVSSIVAGNSTVKGLKAGASNQQKELFVRLDENNKAQLVYLVSWVEYGSTPSRPTMFIDAQTGDVIEEWDGLAFQHATGPGGNGKTGQYFYGTDYDYLEVDDNCAMSTPAVDTVDMNHSTSGGSIFSFTCPENTYKEINGAYSPLNDAHYFGHVVFNMYNDWYQTPPITQKLRMRVHYGIDYESAFWDGSQMTFGDGGSTFYPMVSLDLSAHEVSHGFTEQNSKLSYIGQSGGINEAFSDMAGEAAEYYMSTNTGNGTNDWLVGGELYKDGRVLRYMDDPTRDYWSIGHAGDYHDGLDVHQTSGVFNRAFYLIGHSSGWNTKTAFDIFVLANQVYWSSTSDFDDAACGVLHATADLGYHVSDVVSAFKQVGVSTSACSAVSNEVVKLENGVTVSGLSALTSDYLFFSIDVPADAANLVFTMSGGTGDADLYIKYDSKPTTSSYICRPYKSGNSEACTIDVPQAGTYYVMINGYSSFSGVSLVAGYEEVNGGGSSRDSDTESDLSAGAGEWLYYSVDIPASASNFDVSISGGSGDADLYVRKGQQPTTGSYDCRSYTRGNSGSCSLSPSGAATWDIGVHAYASFSDVTMSWSYK